LAAKEPGKGLRGINPAAVRRPTIKLCVSMTRFSPLQEQERDMSSEHPHPFTPLDPGRVNSMDPVELEYWCQQLQCELPVLMSAIGQVGEHVTAIRDVLRAAATQGR
jgi:hypothetical protein